MMARYIDTHCHLQLAQFANDRDEIIARMRTQGVAAVVVGDDLESSKDAVALAEKYEHIFACVGIHPEHAMEQKYDMAHIRSLIAHPKVVAIGECGLEYFHIPADDAIRQAQKELFQKHIALAAELDKPLMIHVRPTRGTHDAYADVIAMIQDAKTAHPNVRGNIHFFAGSLEEANEFFALDFTISFTAVVTFTHNYDEVIKKVSLENILSETDAPFVAPASRRGERNDPLAIIDVVNQIAAIRGDDPETVRQTILANAQCLFTL